MVNHSTVTLDTTQVFTQKFKIDQKLAHKKKNKLKLNKNCLDDLRFYTNAPERSYHEQNKKCQLTQRMLRLCVSDYAYSFCPEIFTFIFLVNFKSDPKENFLL